MNVQPQLLRLVNWMYKRERDPARARNIWQEFDENRHYADYLARCRAAWRRETAPRLMKISSGGDSAICGPWRRNPPRLARWSWKLTMHRNC